MCINTRCHACAARIGRVSGGTPGFASPEVMQSWLDNHFTQRPETIDGKKADVFSLGATLFKLLTMDTFVELPGSDVEDLMYDIAQCKSPEVRGRVSITSPDTLRFL